MLKLRFRRGDFESYRKDILRIWGPFVALCVVGLVGSYFLIVEPPPPRRITIATGQPTGSYHAFARQYRDALARSGVELEIRETMGSAENIDRLLDPSSGVSVAFVQGAAVPPEAASGRLVALASLYREPLWVFYRGEREIDRLRDLAGLRLAIGLEGSGTRQLSERLLEQTGVTAASQRQAGAPLLALSDAEAAESLAAGRIDAAFFVAGAASPRIQELLRAAGVRLMSFRLHEAHTRRDPYLTSVTIPAGLFDLEREIPPAPVTLVAPTAALIANESLHPALIPLLLEAAEGAHRRGTLLDAPGEFPAARFLEVPVSDEARRYLKDGPSFLNRFLPFWLASLVDRLKFMLLPLATLVFSLSKIAQPLYRWRIRAKIYRHYDVLRRADRELQQGADPARRAETIATLKRLEEQLAGISVPSWAINELYQLYVHLGHVRRRLEAEAEERAPPDGAGAGAVAVPPP